MNDKITGSLTQDYSRTRFIRYGIMLVILAAGLVVLFMESHHLRANDFSRYWLSSRILINGGDPYISAEAMTDPEVSGMSLEQSCITYNPPWVLPLIAVFGLFTRPIAQMIWLLLQISAVLLCAYFIWKLYGGKPSQRGLAVLLSFTFGPVIAAIVMQGQISPFILLGLVGFLLFIDRPNQSWLAGIFLVLTSLKPQVLYLFFIAFLLWIIFTRKWTAAFSFASVILALSLVIYIIHPQVYSQFLQCMREKGPDVWATPTIGTYIRLAYNPTGFQLQFLPPLLGAVWMVIYWIRHRISWDWKREMPLILFIATITAAYIWTYDMVILLVPLLLAFIGLFDENNRWKIAASIIIYLIIDVLYLWLHLRMDDSRFIWLAPALFAWYLIVQGIQKKSVSPLAFEG